MSNKDPRHSSDQKTKKEKAALEDDLKHFGYLLPTNDEELEEFEKIYGTTQVMFPEHLKDPAFLHKKGNKLKSVKENDKKEKNKTKTEKAVIKTFKQNTYFKKLVLAAEVANQLYNEFTFGHVKFVKLLFLCEEVCHMQLNSSYGKYAAGPLDPKSMYSIDAEFRNRKWFDVRKTNYGYKYKPLENIDVYKKYYQSYFSRHQDQIDYIINLFRTEKTDFCEIVATLFAVWKEKQMNNAVVDDAILIEGFYAWSKEKQRFKQLDVLNAITWMKEKSIVPVID